jgi:hypothetical protein
MNKFRKLGYIEYNGKLEIHNSLLNVVLYDKREIGTKDASDEIGSTPLDRDDVLNLLSQADEDEK